MGSRAWDVHLLRNNGNSEDQIIWTVDLWSSFPYRFQSDYWLPDGHGITRKLEVPDLKSTITASSGCSSKMSNDIILESGGGHKKKSHRLGDFFMWPVACDW
jgi:hypothetical protein